MENHDLNQQEKTQGMRFMGPGMPESCMPQWSGPGVGGWGRAPWGKKKKQ